MHASIENEDVFLEICLILLYCNPLHFSYNKAMRNPLKDKLGSYDCDMTSRRIKSDGIKRISLFLEEINLNKI